MKRHPVYYSNFIPHNFTRKVSTQDLYALHDKEVSPVMRLFRDGT